MGMTYVDGGPTLGGALASAFDGLQAAPGKALAQMSAADEIAWNRRMKLDQIKAQQDYQASIDQLAADAVPLTIATPKLTPGPWNPNDPATAMPAPGQPAMPTQTTVALTPDEVGNRQRARDTALARSAGGAAVLANPSTWAQQRGYGGVAARGPATNAYDRTQDTIFLTGHYPTAEQQTAHNFAVYGPNGATGQVVSSMDGGRTQVGGGPIQLPQGYRLLATGPADQQAPNPLKDEATAQQGYFALADKFASRPNEFTPADAAQARALLDRGWGREVKIEHDATTKAPITIEAFKNAPPSEGPGALLRRFIAGLGDAPAPAPAAPAAVAPPPAPAPVPFIGGAQQGPDTAALNAVPAPAAAAAAAAPAVQPIIPPNAVLPNARVGGALAPGDANIVAKEYTDHPLVKSLDQARSGYSSMISAMPNDDAVADLAIFIGAAKVLDPPSVVRDQEGQRIAGGASPMDQFFGKLNRLQGGSGLTRETRLQIWNMVNEKMKKDISNVSRLREKAAVQLTQSGHSDPNKWLDPLPEVEELDRTIVNKQKINADAPEGQSLYYPSPRRYGTGPEPAPTTPAVRPGDRWR